MVRSNLAKNIIYSYASVIITSLIGFISVPLSLNYFGKELYGLFSITNDTLAYLGLFNFGIPWATATIFAKLKSYSQQKQLLLRALSLLILLSGLIFIALALIIILFPGWIYFIANIPPQIIQAAKVFIGVSIAFYVIKLPFSVFSQLLIFINRAYWAKILDLISSLLMLTSLLIVIYFKLSIVQYAYIGGFISLFPLIWAMIIFVKIWQEVCHHNIEESNQSTQCSYLLISSFYFFLNGIGGLVIWNTDSLVISHYLGLGETAEYAVLFKFFMILFMVITQLMNVINPLYPKYFKEDKKAALINIFNLTIRFFPIIGGLIFIIIFGFFKDFVYLWTHNTEIYIGNLACFAMGLYCYFLCASIIPYSVLISLNYTKMVYPLTLLEALINLMLSIYLVNKIGVAGVVFGTLIAHVIVMFFMAGVKVTKLFPELFRFDFIYVFKHLLFILTPSGVLVFLLNECAINWIKIIVLLLIMIAYLVVSGLLLGRENIRLAFQVLKGGR